MIDRKILKEQLFDNIQNIEKSLIVFKYSLNKAKEIGIKEEYNMEELEIFESLTGRYSRTADILTQKIIKTIFMIMQEDAKTFIDRCNLCEKLEIVENADILYNIRNLRNEIAHEYVSNDITEIFNLLLLFSDNLLDTIKNTKIYIDKNIKTL